MVKLKIGLKKELLAMADKRRSASLSKYFKTAKGQYAYGDIFLGIAVPDLRRIALKYKSIDLSDLEYFLRNKIHEFRFAALEILISKYKTAQEDKEKELLVKFYVSNLDFVNNWDLIDASCRHLLGDFYLNRNRNFLYVLARSKNFWHRRIAIVSTHVFIQNNQFEDTLRITNFFLDQQEKQHDLVNKAIGWMLREIGKKSFNTELEFLRQNAARMPRISFRYAVERIPKKFLNFD